MASADHFSSGGRHRSRARLIAARVGDYARGTVARSSLGNCPSIPSSDSPSLRRPLSLSLPLWRTTPSTPENQTYSNGRATYTIDWLTCLVHLQSALDYPSPPRLPIIRSTRNYRSLFTFLSSIHSPDYLSTSFLAEPHFPSPSLFCHLSQPYYSRLGSLVGSCKIINLPALYVLAETMCVAIEPFMTIRTITINCLPQNGNSNKYNVWTSESDEKEYFKRYNSFFYVL